MPRWMPSQALPLKWKSICLALVSEPSRRAPVSLRFRSAVSLPRKTFFPSCRRTASTLAPCPALQRLRKNSTSASSGMLLDAHESLGGVEELLRIVTDAVLEDDFGFAEIGNVMIGRAVDYDQVGGLADFHAPGFPGDAEQ